MARYIGIRTRITSPGVIWNVNVLRSKSYKKEETFSQTNDNGMTRVQILFPNEGQGWRKPTKKSKPTELQPNYLFDRNLYELYENVEIFNFIE